MNNGCICCTVRGDLIRILGKVTILQRIGARAENISRQRGPDPECAPTRPIRQRNPVWSERPTPRMLIMYPNALRPPRAFALPRSPMANPRASSYVIMQTVCGSK